jgi:superfamily II DNA helicase RecQ
VIAVRLAEVREQISSWLCHTQPENDLVRELFLNFDFWQFREPQEELIRAVLGTGGEAGCDVLCVASTGFGKSLLYQLPALYLHAKARGGAAERQVVLVVSPLIALMEDQVTKLSDRHPAHSGFDPLESPLTLEDVRLPLANPSP